MSDLANSEALKVKREGDAEAVAIVRACCEPLPSPEEAKEFGQAFDRFGDAKVVLLGEATHGTSQFYLARAAITQAAEVYAGSDAVIACYGMGLTQHRSGVLAIQMLSNLLLLRGNIGKPGAGIFPVRGHSNVQGQRTVGITDKPELAPLVQRNFHGTASSLPRPERN